MFARVTRFEGRSPDAIDDGVRNAREYILPAFREMTGFRGLLALVDRTTGNWMAVTTWETEDALRATEDPARHLREQALTAGERMASVERYEVAFLELEAGTAAPGPMFARATTFEGRSPETIDDGIRNAQEYLLPALRELTGFRGLFALVDRTSGNWMSITMWETEDAMRAAEDPAKQLGDHALVTGEARTSVEQYEVAFVEVEAGTGVT